MKLNDFIDNLKFDSRVVDWNVKNNVVNEKDVKTHLEKLPDLTDQMVKFHVDDLKD